MSAAHPPSAPLISLLSDIGRTRTENQDRCAAFTRPDSTERLIIVADGMGGHRGGATAAQMAIDRFGEDLMSSSAVGEQLLSRATEVANAEIVQAAEDDLDLEGMGSTVVAILFGKSEDWLMHVGDSRAYRLRDGKLSQLTDDHSTVMELVRAGRIRPEEASTHPRKNEVLRSLGLPDGVEPEIQPLDARPGDRFLLCSDGLTGVVSDDDITYLLTQHTGDAAVHALVDAANGAGGPDNVTVALLEIPGADRIEVPSPRSAKNIRKLLTVAIVTLILLVLMLALFITSSVMRDDVEGRPIPEEPQTGTLTPPTPSSELPSAESP